MVGIWLVKAVGIWSVCGRYVVGIWSVCGRYLVGKGGWYVVGKGSQYVVSKDCRYCMWLVTKGKWSVSGL